MPRLVLALLAALLLSVGPASAQSWVQSGGPPGAEITAMTFAQDGSLYAGTYYGVLYRSTDEGGNWAGVSAGLPASYQSSICVAPNGSIVVATSDSGCWRSTNSGGTWSRVTREFDTGSNRYANDMAVGPDGTIYVAKLQTMFRSDDNGESWSVCPKLDRRTVIRMVLDSSGRLYAIGQAPGQGYNFRLMTSTDRGNSWTYVQRPGDTNQLFKIWIDRRDRLTALVSDTLLYRSTDHGASWFALNNPVPGRGLDGVYSVGDLMFASANGIFLYRSTDNGITWGVPDSTHYDMLVRAYADRGDGRLYLGHWQEGVARSDDSGRTWHYVRDGMTSSTVIDMLAMPDGAFYACTYYTGLNRTTDRGRTWDRITPMINRWAPEMIRNVARGPSGEVLAGGYLGIDRTTDRGNTWKNLGSSGIVYGIAAWRDGRIWVATETGMRTSNDSGATWHYSSSSKEILALAVDSAGNFYHSTEDGTFKAGSRIYGIGACYCIAIHPNGSVYLTAGGGIMISHDGGATFVQSMRPSKDIRAITFAPNGQAFAMALRDGVYRQTGDTTWEPFNDGLPRKELTDIVAAPDGYLYVATWYTGIYRSAVPIPAAVPALRSEPGAPEIAVVPNPFTARSAVRFVLPSRALATVVVRDGLGREVARPIDTRMLEAGTHEAVLNGSQLPAGVYHVIVTAAGRSVATMVVRL